jgi:hypothetical protein
LAEKIFSRWKKLFLQCTGMPLPLEKPEIKVSSEKGIGSKNLWLWSAL